jgi:hypothetical protein
MGFSLFLDLKPKPVKAAKSPVKLVGNIYLFIYLFFDNNIEVVGSIVKHGNI